MNLAGRSNLVTSLIQKGSREKNSHCYNLKPFSWDFPGGPVVKNLLCNAGDVGSIKIPHATEQLSLGAATKKIPYAMTKTRCSK